MSKNGTVVKISSLTIVESVDGIVFGSPKSDSIVVYRAISHRCSIDRECTIYKFHTVAAISGTVIKIGVGKLGCIDLVVFCQSRDSMTPFLTQLTVNMSTFGRVVVV